MSNEENTPPEPKNEIPGSLPFDATATAKRLLNVDGKPIDIFENYVESEHPPYDQWVMDEANNDLALADLIEQREIAYFDMRAANLEDKSEREAAYRLAEGRVAVRKAEQDEKNRDS
jgi:hypothetical protein